jgi:hypothetical protein
MRVCIRIAAAALLLSANVGALAQTDGPTAQPAAGDTPPAVSPLTGPPAGGSEQPPMQAAAPRHRHR